MQMCFFTDVANFHKRATVKSHGTQHSITSLTETAAAILANPETPTDLYNALVDGIFDLATDTKIGLNHPDVPRVALPLILQEIAKGARHD